MSTTKLRVSQEGNLQVPEELLLEMGIGPGDEVLVVGSDSRLLLGHTGSANTPWRLISQRLIDKDRNPAA